MTRPLWVAVAWAALLALVAALAPAFFDPVNLRDLIVRASPLLIVACGMTIVILARQIDISVGSQFAICGMVAGLLAREGVPMPLVALGTMLAGAGLGAINGVLVARLGLPAIVVTLATLVAWREGLRFATEGVWVQDLPAGFQWFGLGQDVGRWLIAARRGGGVGGRRVRARLDTGRTRRLRDGLRRRSRAPARACGRPS